MASISSPGLGSGLDINGIITKLMQVESQPLTALAQKEAGHQAKLSAYGSMKGALSTLQTAARALTSSSTFTGRTANVSDTSVLSAAASATAAAGSYDIAVSKLAKAHALRSNIDFGSDTFDSGVLRITIGSGTSKNIDLGAINTLAGIRDAINLAKAGVTASIVNDGTADRLILNSNTTGATGAITIEAPASNNDGTRRLSDLISANLVEIQPAQNAELTINGLTITRPTNTITDAITGVTLNLVKADIATPPSSKLTVTQNTGASSAAINAFVKAWNDAIGQIKSLTAYDLANKKASTLTGDSAARSIQTQMNNLISAKVTGLAAGVATLSDIGITIQKDGKLATDATKLQAALDNRDLDLSKLFGSTDSNNKGIALRFTEMLEGAIGATGLINSRTTGITASIKDIQKRGEALQLRLAQIEKRYRAQFSALDTLVASMNQTSNYLTQQLANLPGAANTSRN